MQKCQTQDKRYYLEKECTSGKYYVSLPINNSPNCDTLPFQVDNIKNVNVNECGQLVNASSYSQAPVLQGTPILTWENSDLPGAKRLVSNDTITLSNNNNNSINLSLSQIINPKTVKDPFSITVDSYGRVVNLKEHKQCVEDGYVPFYINGSLIPSKVKIECNDNLIIPGLIESTQLKTDSICTKNINSEDICSNKANIEQLKSCYIYSINSDIEEAYIKNLYTDKIECTDNLIIQGLIESKQLKTDSICTKNINSEDICSHKANIEQLKSCYIYSINSDIEEAYIKNLYSDKIESNHIQSQYAKVEEVDSDQLNTNILNSSKVITTEIVSTTGDIKNIVSNDIVTKRIESITGQFNLIQSSDANITRINIEDIKTCTLKAIEIDVDNIYSKRMNICSIESEKVSSEKISSNMLISCEAKVDKLCSDVVISKQTCSSEVNSCNVTTSAVTFNCSEVNPTCRPNTLWLDCDDGFLYIGNDPVAGNITSVGTGESLVYQGVGPNFQLRSIEEGQYIEIVPNLPAPNDTTLIINAAGNDYTTNLTPTVNSIGVFTGLNNPQGGVNIEPTKLQFNDTTRTLSGLTTILPFNGSITIQGDLQVNGDFTSIVSSKTDNTSFILNNSYTSGIPLAGNLVANYSPISPSILITSYISPNIINVSNTSGLPFTVSPGDIIMTSGSIVQPDNNMLYEVAGGITIPNATIGSIIIKNVPLVTYVRNNVDTELLSPNGSISRVNITVLSSGTNGNWNIAIGNNTLLGLANENVIVTTVTDTGIGESLLVDPSPVEGPNIELKSILQGTGINIVTVANDIVITNTSPATSVTLTNAGTGINESLVVDGVGPSLSTKGVESGTGINVFTSSNNIVIENASPATSVTLTNAGTSVGESLVVDGIGPSLSIKGILEGRGINVVTTGNDILISSNILRWGTGFYDNNSALNDVLLNILIPGNTFTTNGDAIEGTIISETNLVGLVFLDYIVTGFSTSASTRMTPGAEFNYINFSISRTTSSSIRLAIWGMRDLSVLVNSSGQATLPGLNFAFPIPITIEFQISGSAIISGNLIVHSINAELKKIN